MKVQNLEIRIPGYGDNAGQYEGKVKLEGENGELVVKLSPGTIGKIFGLIKADVVSQARLNAQLVGQSIENAENSTALIGHTIEV